MVITGTLMVKGAINITAGSTLTVYLNGDADIGGTGIVNGTDIPASMTLFGTKPTGSSQTIKLSGNGALSAVVYAPNATLEMKGGGTSGEMRGAAIANNITIVGNYDFHYDEDLKDYMNTDPSYKMKYWRELVTSGERINFATYGQ
jgi:hypothetical protein